MRYRFQNDLWDIAHYNCENALAASTLEAGPVTPVSVTEITSTSICARYKRDSITTLFAALEVLQSNVDGQFSETRFSEDKEQI